MCIVNTKKLQKINLPIGGGGAGAGVNDESQAAGGGGGPGAWMHAAGMKLPMSEGCWSWWGGCSEGTGGW